MIDAIILLTSAALAWIGWLVGMMKKRAQFWVRFFGPPGVVYLAWYYFFVLLPKVKPALMVGGMQTGYWTLFFMIGGVWALLARPRPDKPVKRTDKHTDKGGAAAA